MKKQPKDGFKIEKGHFAWKGMDIDQVTTFYDKGEVVAEYFHYKGQCNYLLSHGFDKGSLGELRKKKAHKAKKPFFNLSRGWYGYDNLGE